MESGLLSLQKKKKKAIIIQILNGWKNQVQLKLDAEVKNTTIITNHSLSEYRLAIAYLNIHTSSERLSHCKSSITKYIHFRVDYNWLQEILKQACKPSGGQNEYIEKFIQK